MMTIEDALVAYRTYAKAEGKSPKTILWICSSVRYFTDFLGPERKDVTTITGNDLRRFIIALREKGKYTNHPFSKPQSAKLSPLTLDTYCRGIRAFFGFLSREGFIQSSPMAGVKLPRLPEKVIPTLSEKEAEKLLAQPDRGSDEGFRDFALILTFLDTGVRLSEITGLKIDDIDYEESYFKVMGKGSKERFVPFGRRVAKTLMAYQVKHRPQPVGTENFWLRRDGLPLSADRIEKLVSRYGRRAGLKNCHPHQLRHTSAIFFLRNGGDVFSLQRKLGHRSLVMTRRYSNLADTDVRNAQLKYSPGDRLKI